MPRPLPHISRGPRRARPKRPRLLFACPRLSPEWELSALAVLMKPKPHTRAALAHRTGEQLWPAGADAALDHVLATAENHFGLTLTVHRPPEGDYHFLADFDRADTPRVQALALLLSAALPDLWFTLDRLFVHAGRFHRRQFGHRLKLIPASNVHLPRPIRAVLRPLLRPPA